MVLYVIGEYFSKKWGQTQSFSNASVALASYTVSSTCWLGIMSHRNQLTRMSTIWEVVCVVGAFFVGVVWFGETLTVLQWIGLGLAAIAVVLLAS